MVIWMKRKKDVSSYESKHVQQFNKALRKHCKKYGTIVVDDTDTDTDDADTDTTKNITRTTTNNIKDTTNNNNATTTTDDNNDNIDNDDVIVSDNDIWIEFIYYTKNTHRLVHYYCSVRTQRIILHSPPTGARIIIFENELDFILLKFPMMLQHHVSCNIPKLSKELILQMERPHTNKDILESIGIIRTTRTKITKENNNKKFPLLFQKLFNYTSRKNDVKNETVIIDDIDDNDDNNDDDIKSNSTISSIDTTRANNMSTTGSIPTAATIAEGMDTIVDITSTGSSTISV